MGPAYVTRGCICDLSDRAPPLRKQAILEYSTIVCYNAIVCYKYNGTLQHNIVLQYNQ